MAITIRTGAEPYTDATRKGTPSILAESDASRMLVQELRRYCQGKVNGKSFLIAGQRGSGKTTLVLSSLEKLERESRDRQYRFRPLLVKLHGPSLLVDPEDPPTFTRYVKEGEQTVRKEIKLSPIATALSQITLGLYHAIAREMTTRFRKRVRGPVDDAPVEGPRGRLLRRRELLEVAAQLEFELDGYVEAARLRDVWKWGGFFRRGVLFPEGHRRPPDQGNREVLALASLCEANRRISGEFVQEETSSAGSEAKQSAGVAADTSNVDLIGPLVAAASGGVVTAAAWKELGGAPAAAAGLIAALGAGLTFKYSASRSQERGASREITFLPDLSVATLDRVLPVIVKRVREAGLAPVFVVDELDKVDDLSDRLRPIVGSLKKFVAETAVFCFLTDRKYFEEIRSTVTGSRDSVLHTYYTYQLFVTFKPDDLHDYLDRVLTLPGADTAGDGSAGEADRESSEAAADDVGASGGSGEGDPVQAHLLSDLRQRRLKRKHPEEAADRDVLPYVLLHQARMHAVDLHRRLAALRGEGNALSLPLGSVRTARANRFDLMIQLAIEMVLDQPDLRAALDRDPDRRRLVYDALYYPSRAWRHGELTLDLDDRKAFHSYLLARMGLDERPAGRPPGAAAGGAEPTSEDAPASGAGPDTQETPPGAGAPGGKGLNEILDENQEFLLRQVEELAGLLSSVDSFEHEVREWRRRTGKRLTRAVRDALPGASEIVPLLEKVGSGSHSFSWRFRYTGTPAPGTPAFETAGWREQLEANVGFIESLSEFLEGVGKKTDLRFLSSELGVLGSTPAWPRVQEAVRRVRSGSKKRETDVDDYCVLLARDGEVLALALYCARAVAAASGNLGPAGLRPALKILSDAYHWLDFEADSRAEELAALLVTIRSRFPDLPEVELPPELSRASWDSWKKWVGDGLESLERVIGSPHEEDLRRAAETAWEAWRSRLSPHADPDASSPTFEQLVCAAAGQRPADLLSFDEAAMTIRDWSGAFYWSLADVASDSTDYAPFWLAVPAMQRLGLVPGRPRGLEEAVAFYDRRVVGDSEVRDVGLWAKDLAAAETPAAGAALVVERESGTLTESWMPEPSYPAVVLSVDRAAELAQAERRLLGTRLFRFKSLVVEEPSDPDGVKELAKAFLRPGNQENEPDLLLYNVPPDPLPKGIRYLVAPLEGVGDLFERPPSFVAPKTTERSFWQDLLERFRQLFHISGARDDGKAERADKKTKADD